MTLEEIKSRINPAYADYQGTESYERKWLCDRIEELTAELDSLRSDPAIHFAHRFAVVLECMIHSEYPNEFWTEATELLGQYHEAQNRWREAMGEPYVSGFGKD